MSAEEELARIRTAYFSAKGGQEYWYEKNRLLENAVRRAAEHKGHDAAAELVNLLRRVPKMPRKKWRWRG